MESEKVKEIKKALKDHSIEKLKYQDGIKIKEIDFTDILTLINELESENERLKTQLEQANAGIVNCSGCKLVEINAVRDFAEKIKQAICDNTYPYFDKDGKSVNIWNSYGFDVIDELLKEYEK